MIINEINSLEKVVAVDELPEFKIGHESKSETRLINKVKVDI